MVNRFDVKLNGVSLTNFHDGLYILDVEYDQPRIDTQVFKKAKGHGALLSRRYQQNSSVTVSFELHEYDIEQRQETMQEIAKWAMDGGMLTVNDRPGQYLDCICEAPPVIDSALRWTNPISVTFTAYIIPFWQEIEPATVTLTGDNVTGLIDVPGNAGEAMVDAEITSNGTITELTLQAESNIITLMGLNVSSVSIYHDNGILFINSGGVSLLNKRTASSADDLLAISGITNFLRVLSNTSVTCEFMVKGVWY